MTDYTWFHHDLGKYRVEKSRGGCFTSILEDGTEMVTAGTEHACRVCTEYIHMPYHYGSDSSDIKVSQDYSSSAVDL